MAVLRAVYGAFERNSGIRGVIIFSLYLIYRLTFEDNKLIVVSEED